MTANFPPRITPWLWFDDQAEEAATFYTSIFENSRIVSISRYPDAGQDVHGRAAGSVMSVTFELAGQPFAALNGGPMFHFTEAVSFLVRCETQEEVDVLWEKLGEGGDPDARQCGWLKDRYGLSWQIVPAAMEGLTSDPDPEANRRVMEAMLAMEKLDIAALERARAGAPE